MFLSQAFIRDITYLIYNKTNFIIQASNCETLKYYKNKKCIKDLPLTDAAICLSYFQNVRTLTDLKKRGFLLD